jgi:hypothetical protein
MMSDFVIMDITCGDLVGGGCSMIKRAWEFVFVCLFYGVASILLIISFKVTYFLAFVWKLK